MSRGASHPGRLVWAAILLVVALSPLHAGTAAPLLWKIENSGGKPSYLFGTIHLCDPEVATPPEAIARVIASADVVLTEIPMDPATEAAAARAMVLPEKGSLRGILPPELIRQAETEIREINPKLTFAPFDRLKIWALAVSLVPLEAQMRFPDQLPLDRVIYDKALSGGKRTGGIETLEEQIAVFEKFDRKEQILLLRMTLDQRAQFRKDGIDPSAELKEAYLSGDLQKLSEKLDDWLDQGDTALAGKAKKLLFTDRNHLMAGRIAKRLREAPHSSMLFAVGAGHLPGEDGIINLLGRLGFKLTRVTLPELTSNKN